MSTNSQTPGQREYERDITLYPNYILTADPRPSWDNLDPISRHSWERIVILRAQDRQQTVEEYLNRPTLTFAPNTDGDELKSIYDDA